MTNKLSYVHKGCTGKVHFLDSSDILVHFLRSFLAKWAAVHSLVLFTLTLSHIIATRVGLDLSCMTCIFMKFIDLSDQTTGNKKNLGLFKIDRAVVDCNRSVNLPFDVRIILYTYPRKRKDIQESFKCSRSKTCHRSWLEGWLASGAEICLFHGRVVEKTRLHKAFWWTILFQLSSICLNSLQILKAKARIFVWHLTKSLPA